MGKTVTSSSQCRPHARAQQKSPQASRPHQKSRATQARHIALGLLREIRRRDGYARDIIRSDSQVQKLSSRDKAFVLRLVLGVIITTGQLDELLASHLAKPSRLKVQLRDALRIAAYELCYMDTPAPAAINQGVELVRSVGAYACGMANAVLRKIADIDAPRVTEARTHLMNWAAEKPAVVENPSTAERPAEPEISSAAQMPAEPSDDLLATLSLASGAPQWLVRELYHSVGFHRACQLLACLDEAAPVWVSANVLKSSSQTTAALTALFSSLGEAVLPGVYRVYDVPALLNSAFVANSTLVVSDLAARMVCWITSPFAHSYVLEIGQGRATKTLLLEDVACQLGGPASICGVDTHASKTKLAQKRLGIGADNRAKSDAGNVAQPGADNSAFMPASPVFSPETYLSCVTYDGRLLGAPSSQLPEALQRDFDLVFVDAPCSGTGTLRRHPEIMWKLEPEDLDATNPESLPALQLALLRAAATKVAPGGHLMYSTCSVLQQENEQVVEAFLQTEQGKYFELAPVADSNAFRVLAEQHPAAAQTLSDCIQHELFFRSYPQSGSFDGHFCARFVRVR